MPKRLAKSRERRKKPPQNAKGVKWFGATTTATKESRDVTVFPIDAQKWTLSCFRRFFRLCARVSSKRHKRNNACGTPTCPNATADVENFETRISNDHERRDRRIGRPRGVVVARGRRAKGTNDDDSMFVLDDDDDGFHVIAAGHSGWGMPLLFLSVSLSLFLSLVESENERTKRRQKPSSLAHSCAVFIVVVVALIDGVLFTSSPLFFFCLKHKTNTGPNLRRVRNVSRGHGSLENAPRDGRVPGR